MTTGGHSHTANVFVPDQVKSIVYPADPNASGLDDAVLLLRLFTGRDVFCVGLTAGESLRPVLFDSRIYPWGGILRCSLPRRGSHDAPRHLYHDRTFQVELPRIYERMQAPDWLSRYRNGRYLQLFLEAIRQRTVESAFTQCWTIWEHLFACLNDDWLSPSGNINLAAKEKIAFMLVKFALREGLKDGEKKRLEELVGIRNRLIHYGQLPEKSTVYHDAEVFIHMTEFIVAKSLGIEPSNVFNTIERFEDFLQNKSKSSAQMMAQ